MDKKLIEKIRNLMALAEDSGATQAEAEAAMGKAHELLAQHNLSVTDLNDTDEEVGEDTHDNKPWNQQWEKQIWLSIAHLNFCDMYTLNRGTRPHSYVVIGRESNRIATQHVAEFVVNTGKRLALEHAQNNSGNSVSLSNNFKKGFAAGVCLKARQIIEQAKTQKGTPGTGLVLANLYDVTAHENQALLDAANLRKTRAKISVTDASAAVAGKDAGSKVSLSRQVGSGKTTLGIEG